MGLAAFAMGIGIAGSGAAGAPMADVEADAGIGSAESGGTWKNQTLHANRKIQGNFENIRISKEYNNTYL